MTLKKILGNLEWDDLVFIAIPVVLLTPFVIAFFCIGDSDSAFAVLIGEVFFVVVLVMAPTLHDEMFG